MFKKLHKGYRSSINSRIKTFTNNFNHPIHHKRKPNNEVCTYYFVAYLSNKGKVFITPYSNNNYSLNKIRSKCASNKGKLVDAKILLLKDAQNYSRQLQNKLKDIPFKDIKGI